MPELPDDDYAEGDEPGVVLAFVKVIRYADKDGNDCIDLRYNQDLKQVEALGLLAWAQHRIWTKSERGSDG